MFGDPSESCIEEEYEFGDGRSGDRAGKRTLVLVLTLLVELPVQGLDLCTAGGLRFFSGALDRLNLLDASDRRLFEVLLAVLGEHLDLLDEARLGEVGRLLVRFKLLTQLGDGTVELLSGQVVRRGRRCLSSGVVFGNDGVDLLAEGLQLAILRRCVLLRPSDVLAVR